MRAGHWEWDEKIHGVGRDYVGTSRASTGSQMVMVDMAGWGLGLERMDPWLPCGQVLCGSSVALGRQRSPGLRFNENDGVYIGL